MTKALQMISENPRFILKLFSFTNKHRRWQHSYRIMTITRLQTTITTNLLQEKRKAYKFTRFKNQRLYPEQQKSTNKIKFKDLDLSQFYRPVILNKEGAGSLLPPAIVLLV